MPGLRMTKSERVEWRKLITAPFDKQIADVTNANPKLLDDIRAQIRVETDKRLGIAADIKKQQALQVKINVLYGEITELQKQAADIDSAIRARFVTKHDSHAASVYYTKRNEVEQEVRKEVEAKNKTMQKLIKLKAAREAAATAVTLASSPIEMRQLWLRVDKQTGMTASSLERSVVLTGMTDVLEESAPTPKAKSRPMAKAKARPVKKKTKKVSKKKK
jgi:hypothetical protein